ncbi:ECF transporter S component [Nocardioides pocheonensis]|uniref:ECF transporter S component n=1 Tax=Nocardioides pocheonensis TaxID=661485 RepID=A0A3N0GNF8_9ACTN|nr:ECF transporter S component [Nocardioides pocheonensis]RNM13688.1 ECF transporter S component [Nocardioides pocheonensis]
MHGGGVVTGVGGSWRTPLLMALVVLVGVAAFGWPFLASPGSELGQMGHTNDASFLFVGLMTLMALVLLAEMSSGGVDAKTVAVLGVLAAAGGALRVLSAGTAGLEPMFFLLVVAGRALGARLGFMLGALALLASAFLTAGIGPWTPFQMIAAGWVCMGAGMLPRASGRAERWLLAAYGLFCGLAYGVVMNLWFWPFMGDSAPAGAGYLPDAGAATNLGHYAVFYVTTSLAWDLPRGLLTAVLTLLASGSLLRALRRSLRRARFDAVGEFADAR